MLSAHIVNDGFDIVKVMIKNIKYNNVYLVPKLQLGNPHREAPASIPGGESDHANKPISTDSGTLALLQCAGLSGDERIDQGGQGMVMGSKSFQGLGAQAGAWVPAGYCSPGFSCRARISAFSSLMVLSRFRRRA